MRTITRRSFLAASAVSAGLMGLAGCDGAQAPAAGDGAAAPSADSYPIDPDGEGVEAKWASEEVRDGWTRVTQEGGATLGVMDAARIIQVDGYAFRDMNGDGKLELWEDWRQSADDRAAALAAALPAEECIKLMWHGGDTSMGGGPGGPGAEASEETEKYDLVKAGSRAGVSRLSSDLESCASDISWINDVQEICEQSEWGIPYLNSTDQYQLFGLPDNLAIAASMDKDVWRKAGMWLGRAWRATGVRCLLGPQVDVYSQPLGCRFSGSVGEDPALNRDFTAAFSGGLQSTWGDDDATDDQGWGKDSVAAMLKHYVGEGSVEGGRNDHADPGRYNVFPGDNFNAHLVPFLDGGLHLDSTTGQMDAVMPCYGVAYDEDEKYGELVGAGYNKRNLDILRNAGWDGMFCTDWGIINQQTYGVGSLTEAQRYEKMVNAGIDQYGGAYMYDTGMEAYEALVAELGEEGALERVRESARRIAKVMIHVSLFEQPYSDVASAREVLESEAAAAFGLEAAEKSVVMLKNAGGVIKEGGLGAGAKVYMPVKKTEPNMFVVMMGGDATPTFDTAVEADLLGDYDVVSDGVEGEDIVSLSAEELADVQYAIVKVKNPTDPNDGVTGGVSLMGGDTGEPLVYHPITLQYRPYTADSDAVRKESIAHVNEAGEYENRSYFGQSASASNESDLDLVLELREKLPEGAKIILLVEATRPMVFSEIEPYVDVILFAWNMQGGLQNAAWANIIKGEVEPTGLLNAQHPANMETVEASYEDVPRDLECYVDSEGNTYEFCFGLNWSGVIDDERTATYKAAPLTEPETEVTPGE
ncbi:glycoside hydrolase family 3 N-terminal domain-containing protein [Olsenella sp. An188]|uniref:glycoside hydrolase family 3 N-terminal domain-containing protein n=1 Tax=Olsenella sp. An188 TaxID=1965579 RepID=UPI000B381C64|nr:glycoside hydrolase family 3 N-terminal domain-containing protein [Olsenella sp. An188]OUP39227.1 hypothetical protein B5F23_03660 [Olsenella sp. An188]